MCNDVTKQTFYQNNAIVITRHAALFTNVADCIDVSSSFTYPVITFILYLRRLGNLGLRAGKV